MTNLAKALAFLNDSDVSCYEEEGKIYIYAADLELELSEAEITYRAECYDMTSEEDED